MKKLNKYNNQILIVFLFTLLFSDYLGNKIHKMFFYTDELLLVILILMLIYKIYRLNGKGVIRKEDKKIIYPYFIIYIFGFLGNILSKYQTSITAIILDSFATMKFFIAFMCTINIINDNNSRNLKELMIKFAKWTIIAATIIECLNLSFGFMGSEKYGKFGLYALTFGGHPYFATATIACATSILTFNIKKNKFYIMFGFILTALTFRTKAYLYIAMMIFSFIFFRKSIKIWKIILIGTILLIIGWNKIEYYFLDPTATRSILLTTSIDIAEHHFPIGSGFATFGSTLSGKYYSKAYEIYKLNTRYGFSPQDYSFITDGGWANIIGQFGIIGLLGYIYMFFNIVIYIYRRNKQKKLLPYIGLLGYMFISSTNENAFTSNYTILYAIVLAILIKKIPKEETKNEI